MFRKWEIPVKTDLKVGENLLQIKFKSAVNVGKELAQKNPFTMPESPRSFVRKSAISIRLGLGTEIGDGRNLERRKTELLEYCKN